MKCACCCLRLHQYALCALKNEADVAASFFFKILKRVSRGYKTNASVVGTLKNKSRGIHRAHS